MTIIKSNVSEKMPNIKEKLDVHQEKPPMTCSL